jgi:hypothetical protein
MYSAGITDQNRLISPCRTFTTKVLLVHFRNVLLGSSCPDLHVDLLLSRGYQKRREPRLYTPTLRWYSQFVRIHILHWSGQSPFRKYLNTQQWLAIAAKYATQFRLQDIVSGIYNPQYLGPSSTSESKKPLLHHSISVITPKNFDE